MLAEEELAAADEFPVLPWLLELLNFSFKSSISF